MNFVSILVVVLSTLTLSSALFEDQAGKWDWRRQYVGSVRDVVFDAGRSPSHIFVATKDNVVANIAMKTGTLNWRHVLEETPNSSAHIVTAHGNVVALSADGRTVRAWHQTTGLLKWSEHLVNATSTPIWLSSSENTILVLTGETLTSLGASRGAFNWRLQLTSPPTSASLYENTITIIGTTTNDRLPYTLVDASRGMIIKTDALPIKASDSSTCRLHSHHVVCVGTSGAILVADLIADAPQWSSSVALGNAHVGDNQLIGRPSPNIVLVHNTATNQLSVVAIGVSTPAIVGRIAHVSTASLSDEVYVTSVENDGGECTMRVHKIDGAALHVIDAWTRSLTHATATVCPAKFVFAKMLGDEHHAVVVGADESVLALNSKEIVWARHEALSHTIAMEMLDLPLTDSQTDVEIEFETGATGMLSAFVRRISTQTQQLRKGVLQLVNQLLTVTNMWSSLGEGLRSAVRHDLHIADDETTNELHRDYFNLHKLIVALTADRVVYGVDNRDGRIVWSLYLGDDVKSVLPHIYVTRTTVRHGLDARVSLLMQERDGSTMLSIQPISGEAIERVGYGRRVKHCRPVPYETDDGVQALLLVDEQNTAQLYPSSVHRSSSESTPLYLMTSTQNAALISYKVNITPNGVVSLVKQWHTSLRPATEEIADVIVAPIDINQHVHSQGRVLGDRSVLYKYVNRNQVAILVSTADAQLFVYIVDSVSGAIIHEQRHAQVAAPFHVVHCENWLMYTLWNEKARRSEVSVVELFEGAMQTDVERFSSFAPTLHAPIVERQAYIFPHEVTAVQVTNTERGLTNRMLLFALPFGGILQMPKAFIDPRRPVKPTPEHREEGVIPYMPELPLSAENMVNYNQTTLRVRHMISRPSGLESTTLMCAAGLDMFYTRLTPSGTFDILKDDFDHWLICAVLVALLVASHVTKTVARNRDLAQAWK